MGTIRDILNEQKWRYEALESLQIAVVHRGAPGDQRVIDGVDVRDIGPNGLVVAVDLGRVEWEAELVDVERAASCDGTSAPLFERRVIEERVGVRV